MKVYRSLKISQKTLFAHKLRTILALLGIIVGVSAVIIMIAIGNGAEEEVVSKIEAMGTNLVIVNAGEIKTTGGRQFRGNVTTLTLKDIDAIEINASSVIGAAPIQANKLLVKFGNLSTNTTVVGSTSNFTSVRNFNIDKGVFFTDMEDKASMRVAVLGAGVVKNIFGNDDPINSTIRIGKVPFTVIGVLESKGVDMYGTDQDDQIIIPIRTALRRVFNQTYINTIYLEIDKQENMEMTVTTVQEILHEMHKLDKKNKPDDFTIQNQVDLIEAQKETSNTFTALTASIAGVSLIVGGIGILAVMLLSIRERTNEIGLRMAVGARRKDIRTQFIFESSFLSIGGGIIGILIGVIAALAIKHIFNWSIVVSLTSIILSFGFSMTIGLFFGVYPAHRASLLDPINALRSE
ncbi:MAG: ABC transporter permease [Ignavibacteriae bacterium]|nr:ABC transporter permease [Ignavibacteriota bacterium]